MAKYHRFRVEGWSFRPMETMTFEKFVAAVREGEAVIVGSRTVATADTVANIGEPTARDAMVTLERRQAEEKDRQTRKRTFPSRRQSKPDVEDTEADPSSSE